MTEKINCDKHGRSDSYLVCIHTFNGIPPALVEFADESEDGFGASMCAECAERYEDESDEEFEKLLKDCHLVCRCCAIERGIIPWREGDPVKPVICEPSMINGELRNQEHPDTFTIPELLERRNCRPGYYVKIGWELEDERGERMWVKITEIKDGRYLGVLSNTPVVVRGLKMGQKVKFGPENILAIREGVE